MDRCIKIAVAYRQKFKKDFFIDIIGYRRYGHNEQDQPFFTQPLMYEKIRGKPTVYEEVATRLIKNGVLTSEEIRESRDRYLKAYEEDYTKVINDQVNTEELKMMDDPIYKVKDISTESTGVSKDILNSVFETITTWPENFNIHPTIKKIYDERRKHFHNNENLDWATMESLAFGSLLQEGYGVRLSGQDV